MTGGAPEHDDRLVVHLTRDRSGLITSVEETVVELLGWRPEQMVGLASTTFIHPEDQAGAVAAWMGMITAPGQARVWRCRYRGADGRWNWVETVNTLGDDDVVSTFVHKVPTPEARVEDELRAREQLLSRLSDALSVGVFQIDTANRISFTNDRLHSILGTSDVATLEAQMASVIPDDGAALRSAVESVLGGADVDDTELRLNSGRVCQLSLRPLTDTAGVVTGAVGCLSDVTDSVLLRRELEVRASVDALTSCLNRAATLELLEEATAERAHDGRGTALVFLDVDHLKQVNDQFGHSSGDRLLVEFSLRLRDTVRDRDHVGRLGGDEFVVVCPGVESAALASRIAERIRAAVGGPVDIGTEVVELRASVGVAWTDEPIDVATLVACADDAMYESKRRGGGATLFSPSGTPATPLDSGSAPQVGTRTAAEPPETTERAAD